MIPHTPHHLEALKRGPVSNYLYVFQLGANNYYLTDSDSPIDYEGFTFLPGYISEETEDIEVTSEPKINDMDIVLFTHNSTFIDDVTNGSWMNKPIEIYRRFSNEQGEILTLSVFKGLISEYSLSEEDHTITITSASIWADYEKSAGIRTSISSHQVHYPDDTAMRHAAYAQDKIYWGIDSPISSSNSSGVGSGYTPRNPPIDYEEP